MDSLSNESSVSLFNWQLIFFLSMYEAVVHFIICGILDLIKCNFKTLNYCLLNAYHVPDKMPKR